MLFLGAYKYTPKKERENTNAARTVFSKCILKMHFTHLLLPSIIIYYYISPQSLYIALLIRWFVTCPAVSSIYDWPVPLKSFFLKNNKRKEEKRFTFFFWKGRQINAKCSILVGWSVCVKFVMNVFLLVLYAFFGEQRKQKSFLKRTVLSHIIIYIS